MAKVIYSKGGRLSAFMGLMAFMGLALFAFANDARSQSDETVELTIKDLTAYGRLLVPEGAEGAPIALITHGTLAHHRMELVANLQDLLAEQGIASLAHTLTLSIDRREGMYDCAQPQAHRHEDAVDEIAAWQGFVAALGFDRQVLIGHSRGGNQVAMRLSQKLDATDDMISGAVLIAPQTFDGDDAQIRAYKSRFDADLAEWRAKADDIKSSHEADTLMEVPGLLYCPQGVASAGAFLSYLSSNPDFDTPHLLTRYNSGKLSNQGIKPVLVIAAGSDNVVQDLPEKMVALGQSPQISFAVIEGADHMFLDFFIEDAAMLITDFIAQF